MKIKLHFTQSGFPALWEEGGGLSNRGSSQIIANADGSAKNPVHVRKKGHLACAQHGLFIVRPGDYIIRAGRYRDEYDINIYKIEKIEGENAVVSTVEGQPEHLTKAVEAAKKKARCYHCRCVHYDRGTYRVVQIIRKHTFPDGRMVTLGEVNKKNYKYFVSWGDFSGKEIPRKEEGTEWFYDLDSAEREIQHRNTLIGYSVRAKKEVEKALEDAEKREKVLKAFPRSKKESIAHVYYQALWKTEGKATFDMFIKKILEGKSAWRKSAWMEIMK